MRLTSVFTGVIVLALTACTSQQYVKESLYLATPETKKELLPNCEASTQDWVRAFVLPLALREEALSTVETYDNAQHAWLRAILLTHSEASYHDLREAESIILNQLQSADDSSSQCPSDELLDYILKLNQMLQKRKSEVVLLQRQINEQNKTLDAVTDENTELKKKIEALANIEHRMKQRSKTVAPEGEQ